MSEKDYSKVSNKRTASINVQNGKIVSYMNCKEGQFAVVEVKTFGINLNAQHVNGMTQCTVIRYSKVTFTWFLFLWEKFCRKYALLFRT